MSHYFYMFLPLLSPKQRHWIQFLLTMTKKEIKVRYKHTIFGFLWAVMNPLLQMAIIGTVFQFFVPVKVHNYFAFLFAGLLAWDFLSMTLSRTTPLYVHERSLLQKASFPREVIFLSNILANMFHLVIAMGVFWLINTTIFGQSMSWSVFCLPVAVLWLLVVTAGLSGLTGSLNVQFRDVDFMVKAILPLWLYATPVLYTIQLIPERWHWLFYLNPMVGVVELFRFSLLNLPVTDWGMLGVNGLISVGCAAVGVVAFRRLSPHFVDWL